MEKISASELRIRNIHEGDDFSIPRLGISSVKIDGKSFNHITSYGIHLVDEGKMEFKPIALTEEWLVKFGFTKGGDRCYRIHTIRIFININKTIFAYAFEGAVNIKFVHQLQNLFFALTGEELTIKS